MMLSTFRDLESEPPKYRTEAAPSTAQLTVNGGTALAVSLSGLLNWVYSGTEHPDHDYGLTLYDSAPRPARRSSTTAHPGLTQHRPRLPAKATMPPSCSIRTATIWRRSFANSEPMAGQTRQPLQRCAAPR